MLTHLKLNTLRGLSISPDAQAILDATLGGQEAAELAFGTSAFEVALDPQQFATSPDHGSFTVATGEASARLTFRFDSKQIEILAAEKIPTGDSHTETQISGRKI